MAKVKSVKPRNVKVQAGTIGNLYAQHSTSSWKPPEILPELDSRYKRIGIDCESDGTDWRGKSLPIGWSLALEDGRSYYLPIRHRGGGNLDAGVVNRFLQTELRGKELIFAEGKFDIQMARKDGIDFEKMGCKPREVQYSAALLDDQRRSFKLDDLAWDYLGKRKLDIDRSSIWELPSSEVGPYAEQDGRLNLELDTELSRRISSESLTRVERLENDLIYCVCEMERNGAPLDIPKLTRWRSEARSRYAANIFQIANDTGLRINPDSPVELAKLFDKLGVEYSRTATGLPSFPDEFIRTFSEPSIRRARESRALRSLLSKYLDSYGKAEIGGRLYYKLHQLKGDEYGTISGRFSSSSKNIQQVFAPGRQVKKFGFRDYIIRELFVPEPGYVWVRCDAAQIEFRGFAHYANSERLLRRYRENPWIDFHDVVMEMLRTRVDIDRDDSKNMNFGRLYGMGRDKNARKLGLSREEADELFEAYDEEFPEAKALMKLAMTLAEKRGYVKTILGRIARFPGAQRLHSALNRVIQGTAADIMKLKLLEVYNNRELLNLKIFFTVHDEIDGQQPPDKKYLEMFRELLNTQIEEIKFRVPILWDVKSGMNWAECK